MSKVCSHPPRFVISVDIKDKSFEKYSGKTKSNVVLYENNEEIIVIVTILESKTFISQRFYDINYSYVSFLFYFFLFFFLRINAFYREQLGIDSSLSLSLSLYSLIYFKTFHDHPLSLPSFSLSLARTEKISSNELVQLIKSVLSMAVNSVPG